jgi:hypothetical protein
MTVANFCPCQSFDPISYILSYIYLLLLKILRIFLIRIAAARIKLCPCSYFVVAKNPRDYSSYAVHQQDAANKARCVS